MIEAHDPRRLLAGYEQIIIRRAIMGDRDVRYFFSAQRVGPTAKKFRGLSRKRIRAKSHARSFRREQVGEITRLVGVDLLADFGKKTIRRRVLGFRRPFEQSENTLSGNQIADLLALCGDVDADDPSPLGQSRTAAHARIERAGKMNFRIQRMLQQSVVSPFDYSQAEIARMTDRVKPRSLLHR